MGLNTTVVILNDALGYIQRDAGFGERLSKAIQSFDGRITYVSAGHFANAAIIVETHHADYSVDVRVGGNTGTIVPQIEAKALRKQKRTKND